MELGREDSAASDNINVDLSTCVPLARELVRLLDVADGQRAKPDDLRAASQVAVDLAERLGGDHEAIWELEETADLNVFDLLLGLPFELAHVGLVDQASETALALAFMDPENFLADRAILLADAGRREEALAQVEHNQTEFPDDVWVEIKAGDVHAALGDVAEAETLYRRALGRADRYYDREGVLERLVPLLCDQGRRQEADQLQAEEQQRRSELLAHRTVASPTVRRDEPKVGRNDPCRCGSGKKYKKCCGG